MIKGRRIYHTRPFHFMSTPYRTFVWPWWKYWLNPRSYINAVRAYYERARYGYAYEDLFSLDSHLSQWLPFALRDFYEQDTITVKWNSKKSYRQIATMAQGFESHYQVASLDYILEDHKKYPYLYYSDNWKNMSTHFKAGMKEFQRHFFHLWW